MLELLSLRKGTTLTKEMFLNHLYGGMDEPEPRSSTCSSASCARSWRMPATARTTSRRCGAGGYVLREPTEEESAHPGLIKTVSRGRGSVLREPTEDEARIPA